MRLPILRFLIPRIIGLGLLAWSVAPSSALACFGNDGGAFSTQRSDHHGWASSRSPGEFLNNLLAKIDALSRCWVSDDRLRDLFADLSVIIANYAPRDECFGKANVTGTQRQAHRDWAATKSRQEFMADLRWKANAAMHCIKEFAKQADYFADMSVAMGRMTATAPPGVAWRLGEPTTKDAAPSGTKGLRIDEIAVGPKGGLIRITALDDGGCAPEAGLPGHGLSQRFWFRWSFSRDITTLAFPDKFDILLSIEADSHVPCFDLNPIMTAGSDEVVLATKPGGARFLMIPNAQAGHVGGPRTVEVVSPESGLERSSRPVEPFFKIAIWGFRGHRGMQLETTYPFELIR